jgi:poly(3-hydroxybutyrate) depolymerase
MGRVRTSLLLAALLCTVVRPASAEMIEKSGSFGGLKVTYKVVLPANYDPARAYPAVLVFTGGPQTLQMAGSTLETDWRSEAERRGYIVISPGSPNGDLFFEGADRIFPSFLDAILRDYKIAGGKLHIAGHSNGGLSAFHVAALHPTYFSTVTGYPGLLDGPDAARAQAIKPMCLFMHVGDQDAGWMSAMQAEAKDLTQKGFRIKITVEKNQIHRLKAAEINLSNRLFDEIESCSR